jgi:Fur family transcriptional regulator, iron response regulator
MKQSSLRPLVEHSRPVILRPSGADTVERLKDKLRAVGLLPTRSRIALYSLLFDRGHRHVSAEALFDEAKRKRVTVSLATVYNTLRQFCEAGLLRSIAVDGTKSYYDTKVADHQHFYLEDRCELIDLPNNVRISGVPTPPTGYVIDCIDVMVRLRPQDRASS